MKYLWLAGTTMVAATGAAAPGDGTDRHPEGGRRTR